MTRLKLPAGTLAALLLVGVSGLVSVPGLAGPTLDTLSPDDNGNNRLAGFTFLWATAGTIAPVNADTPEVDAAAVFFSGSDFLGIDTLHDRGYRTIGTIADVMAGDAVPADAGSAPSSSVFVAIADEDDTEAAASAVPPSPGDPAPAAGFLVVPPLPDAASSALDSRQGVASGPSLRSRQAAHRPAAEIPTLAAPTSAGPASDQQPSSLGPRGSISVFKAPPAIKAPAPDAVRQWLLAHLVAGNQAFTPSGSAPPQPSVEDFTLTGAPALDRALPSGGTAAPEPKTGSVVVLPVTPFPTLDAGLDANVRIYANTNTGIALSGRLRMILNALETLTMPEIISIALAASGLVGLGVVWRQRRRREALAYRLDP